MTLGRTRDAALAGVLFIIAIVAYWQTRKLWWTFDDAFLLHTVSAAPYRSYFFSIAFWRHLPAQMFDPLLLVEYRAIETISGMFDSRLFYAVHIATIATTAVLAYIAYRMWLKSSLAFAAALLLILGTAFVAISTELMAAHYVVALALSIASVLAFEKRKGAVAAALYFAAALAKEIVLPLPAYLLLLPGEAVRVRARRTIPLWIAASVYMIWRRVMIGTLSGGYGWAFRASLLPAMPRKVAETVAGPNAIAGAALLVVTGAMILSAFRNTSFAWRAVVAIALALAPVAPVSHDMQARYALAFWVCWASLFVAAIAQTTTTLAMRTAVCVTAAVLAIIVNRTDWSAEFSRAKRMSEEARAFMRLDSQSVLRDPRVPPAAMNEFRWLKEEVAHGPRGTTWFYDDFYLCAGHANGKRVWEFQSRHVNEINVARVARASCGAVLEEPLAAQFHYDGAVLSWTLGPYRDGSWRFVFADGAQAYDVPQQDAFQIGSVHQMSFRIRYQSPAGWVTYSPELALDFEHDHDIAWRR